MRKVISLIGMDVYQSEEDPSVFKIVRSDETTVVRDKRVIDPVRRKRLIEDLGCFRKDIAMTLDQGCDVIRSMMQTEGFYHIEHLFSQLGELVIIFETISENLRVFQRLTVQEEEEMGIYVKGDEVENDILKRFEVLQANLFNTFVSRTMNPISDQEKARFDCKQ